MPFQYLNNLPLEEARAGYPAFLRDRGFARQSETVPVEAACGRVTARAVYARVSAPHYPACAMDGIAIRASDSFGAGETAPVKLAPERWRRVDTGDPLPPEADAVVMIEDVVWEEGCAVLREAAVPWQHVRQIGEDICAGEMILPGGMELTPAAVGALLAGGVLRVEVWRRPLVGVIPTGDEVVPPSEDPRPGQVPEFNSAIFSAMVKRWGGETRLWPVVRDDPAALRATLREAAQQCDLVLLNAGTSAGRDDDTAAVIAAEGELYCHGVAIKPGKPAALGACGGKPVIGVPGYPVSGIIVLEQFLKPLLERLTGRSESPAQEAEATLSRAVVSGLKYREFVRVRLGRVGEKLIASPLARGSGIVSSFMKADGILEIPQGLEGHRAGETVRVRLLRPAAELERSLVIIGSHDPLLDELADLIHAADPTMFVSSAHVGSMGGIMALRRGEAHAAGCHLLNEADGSYNTVFLEKYFPNGGLRQVECVGRTQGLMVAKGNPLGLRGFADLAKPGLRYVNRQKGSGTRLLADYLCRTQGVDPAAVNGYEREEFTHISVAAQIASGTADAGMGIWSAARSAGLDFIPICMEQYDLLIPDYAWETPMVRRLIGTLKSPEFRRRLEALGGYTLDRPGEVRRRF